MNPVWLMLIVPFSVFFGIAIMCWVGARATDDFHAAIARRDKMIEKKNAQINVLHATIRLLKGTDLPGNGELWIQAT